MKFLIAALILAFAGTAPSAVLAEAPETIANPIIPGFNPDPSIVRVGEDYYIATSSFEYFPGVPIYHSRNLVNWTLIGHALSRPEQLDLDGIKSSGGIYAPALRYHDGTFYMITTLVSGGREGRPAGHFIVTTKDPRGPWSDPIWIENSSGIDPSLFFDDDGKVYFASNGRPDEMIEGSHRILWFSELDPVTFQLKGERTILDSGPWLRSGLIGNAIAIEGPHVYKKDGSYYLIAAHGGTGLNHAESIWRGPTPLGPWTVGPDNPIVTHRDQVNLRGINATGHADLVQTPDGDWWMVLLGIRSKDDRNSLMGRETFLVPVDWSGEWPKVNPAGEAKRVPLTMPAPALPDVTTPSHDFYDDFDSERLDLRWNFIRTPRTQWWSFPAGEGLLRLNNRPEEFAEFSQPSFLGIRVPQARARISVNMDFAPKSDGEAAGVAVMRGHEGSYTLVKERVGGQVRLAAYADKELVAAIPWRSELDGPIELTISVDGLSLDFLARSATMKVPQVIASNVAAPMLGYQRSGRWTGTMAGPFATSRGAASTAHADFQHFVMTAD